MSLRAFLSAGSRFPQIKGTVHRRVVILSCSRRLCCAARSRFTQLSRHVATRKFLYGGAFLLPFGRSLYKEIDPSLTRDYANIVHRYDSNSTMEYVIALNVLVFLTWQFARIGVHTNSASLQKIYPFMKRHFVLDPQTAWKPSRWHTCLTSMFSHVQGWHILANCMALWSFGGVLHQAVGRELWLGIYIGGGVFGGIAQIMSNAKLPAHGASAAVLAVIAANILYAPYDQKMGFMLTPESWYFPKPNGLAFLIALDVVGLIRGWKLFAHAGHLGGTMFGLASFWLLGRTIGTTDHGECLYKSSVYEGPLEDFFPTDIGMIHRADGNYATRIKPDGSRTMILSTIRKKKRAASKSD